MTLLLLFSCWVWLFVNPWTAACQGPLSFTISQDVFKLMSIESVMPSNDHILCHPLFLPSIFSIIRVFSLMAQLVKKLPAMWETWVRSLGWEDLLGKGKAIHSSILAWRIPWTKSWTWLSNLHTHTHRVFFNESALRIRWPKHWTFSFTSVLPVNIQDWFPLGLTGLISLLSKGLSRVFSNTTVQKHQFFSAQPSLWSNSHIHIWLLEKP